MTRKRRTDDENETIIRYHERMKKSRFLGRNRYDSLIAALPLIIGVTVSLILLFAVDCKHILSSVF